MTKQLSTHGYIHVQIADFGMARDVTDDTYHVSTGGKIPVRWTAPEVDMNIRSYTLHMHVLYTNTYIYYVCRCIHCIIHNSGFVISKVFSFK